MKMNNCQELESELSETVFLIEDISFSDDLPYSECPRAFTSLQAATRYMAMLIEDARNAPCDADQREDARQNNRYVIREYRLNDESYLQRCAHAWEYSIDGELLREEPEDVAEPSASAFSQGNLVEVLPRLVEPSSLVFKRLYGVVIGGVNGEMTSVSAYRLYTIHDYGHLVELSVAAHCLRMWEKPLPTRMHFLQVYSEHLKGIQPLPKSVARYVRPGDTSILVDNLVSFDFDHCCVRPPHNG